MFQKLNFVTSWLLTFLAIAIALPVVTAQPGSQPKKESIRWSYELKKVSDNEFDLVFKADLDPQWHVYGPYQEYKFGETAGPKPMEINYISKEGFSLSGRIKTSPKPERYYDEVFEIYVNQFDGNPVFTQRIKVTTDKPFTIKGTVDGQICLDYCIPFESDFSFEIKGVKLPAEAETDFPTADSAGIEQKVKADEPLQDKGSEVRQEDIAGENDIDTSEKKSSGKALLSFFLLALGLGIAGIFTPCVFPMIPMNIAFFLNYKGGRTKGKFLAVFYGLSIIFIYSVIGLLITVIFGAQAMNDIVSHWLTNVIFFLIFVVFAASFFGAFELVMPSKWVNKADAQVDRGGLVGTFFMALTLVLVSFSCTAAFIGTILVEAADGTSLFKPFIGMLGFSIGFGVPFALLALFPSVMQKMPKSGGWMNAVKVVFGFIILAFGMKFLIVPDQTYHLGLLSRDLYIAVWIVLFSLMGLYLLGKFKFHHDTETGHIGFFRLLLVIATFSFVVYLIPGLFGADLKGISSLLPPKTSQKFNITATTGQPSSNNYDNLCGTPLHSDFLKLPHNLKGYFDLEEALSCAKERNLPVFIDFTGYGCSNCKKMENKVWSDPRVQERLSRDFIIVALYNDDKTSLPKDRWIKTEDGKVLKTIDKVTKYIQQTRFGSVAVPYYVITDTDGNMIAGPWGSDFNVEGFIEFLDSGKKKFKENN